MALISCPECNINVSDKALKCPKCGYPIKSHKGFRTKSKNIEHYRTKLNPKMIIAILLFILVVVVIGITVKEMIFTIPFRDHGTIVKSVDLPSGSEFEMEFVAINNYIRDAGKPYYLIELETNQQSFPLIKLNTSGGHKGFINVFILAEDFISGVPILLGEIGEGGSFKMKLSLEKTNGIFTDSQIHYWLDGKKVRSVPIDLTLNGGKINFISKNESSFSIDDLTVSVK